MSRQEPITIITPVRKDQVENLQGLLKQLNFDVESGIPESFEKIGTIHFARWLLIDEPLKDDPNNESIAPDPHPGAPTKLVFESNFDGEIDQHIKDLSEHAANIIDQLYSNCEGYPDGVQISAKDRFRYLTQYVIRPSAFYRGSPGRSLTQIRQEDKLHSALRGIIDRKNYQGWPAQKVLKDLQENIRNDNGFDWTNIPFKMPRTNYLAMAGIGIILLLLLPFIIIWVLIVQYGYERHDTYFTMRRSELDSEKIKGLEVYEDIEIQNQFSQLVEMKAGKVRLFTYKAFMFLARGLIRFQFVEGKLMGIPTIHFARWVLFDDDKRVIFFSNFDGSWQQYLGDFIDQSGWGLTGIFSNTKNFPKTKFLLTGGAYDEEHFLAWSRNSEIKTHLWYSAYPHLSIKNVNNNSRIRAGLMKDLNEKQAARLLKLI